MAACGGVATTTSEPAVLHAPLEEFLICENGDHDRAELAALVELVFSGAEPSNRLELRTVANPEVRLQGRVTSCGPPADALLILTPLTVRATASRRRRPASNRNLVGVGARDSVA